MFFCMLPCWMFLSSALSFGQLLNTFRKIVLVFLCFFHIFCWLHTAVPTLYFLNMRRQLQMQIHFIPFQLYCFHFLFYDRRSELQLPYIFSSLIFLFGGLCCHMSDTHFISANMSWYVDRGLWKISCIYYFDVFCQVFMLVKLVQNPPWQFVF